MPSWIEIGGTGLRYEVEGEGRTAIVFVNAMGTTVESWDELTTGFAKRHRVIRYDMRGTGLSERIVGPYSFDDAVSDLTGLIEAVVPEGPLVLVGAALGGAVALALAAREKRVAGLILLSPVTGVAAEQRSALLSRADEIEEGKLRHFIETDILPKAYPEVLRTDRDRYERFRLRHLSNDCLSYAATQRLLATIDLSETFEDVTCPTLVVSGSHDIARPPELTRAALVLLIDVRFETIASGHFMAAQTPDLVAPILADFLDGIAR